MSQITLNSTDAAPHSALIALSNVNMVVEKRIPGEKPKDRRVRIRAQRAGIPWRSGSDEQLSGQLAKARRTVTATACSSAWAEDCLYRGALYVPDFQCQCRICREKFPQRLYPHSSRQSNISTDCQVEAMEDPEFAEDFARLRNDRARVGSVFFESQGRRGL
jgi:hypothetical protein